MRAMLLMIGFLLAGCDTGESCDIDGATRCLENAAESCTSGAWEITDDCDANGQTCMQDDTMMEGDAHCM